MEELSIGQVAKRAGISARMLRHYDRIGLFVPTRVSGNGYRWYAVHAMPRLYRIIALRRAGLGLESIAGIVADQEAEAEALRKHLVELRAERDRIDALIDAIDEQILQLDQAHRVARVGQGSHAGQSAAFARRLERAFGRSAARALDSDPLAGLTDADVEHVTAEMNGLMAAFAELMNSGLTPDSAQVQLLVEEHYALTCRYWPADIETYRRLGELYETDPLQREIVSRSDPALPAWLARAIKLHT